MKLQAKVFLMTFFLLSAFVLQAQNFAVKTNLFYGGFTQTPNIGAELGLGSRSTLDVGFGYNPWNLNGKKDASGVVVDNRKLVHWVAGAEYRYWLCEKFNGHFFGVHALGSLYNIAEYNLPLLFGDDSKDHRFEGWAAGGGISYGYQFVLGRNWNLEANIGAGYLLLEYDKYCKEKCGEPVGPFRRHYLGPTKAGLSLIYVF